MSASRPRALADLSAPQVGAAVSASSVLVLPLGAVEQHGPHLPLTTDLLVVEAFADAVAARAGEELDLWVLPSLTFTKSNEHAWSPGTVWLSPETLLATLRDVGRSLATLPARRLVLLNGHGGNTGLLDVACRELRLAHGLLTFLLHPSLPADHGGAGHDAEGGLGIHGGIAETSLLLHLRPDLVRMEHAVANLPTWLGRNRHVRFGGVGFGWTSLDFGDSGVIGDPTLATAELGRALFDQGVDALTEALREVAAFDFPAARPVGAAS